MAMLPLARFQTRCSQSNVHQHLIYGFFRFIQIFKDFYGFLGTQGPKNNPSGGPCNSSISIFGGNFAAQILLEVAGQCTVDADI